MKDKYQSPEERELAFNRFIVSEYLKHGSVDEIYVQNHYDLPVSYPQAHRIINSWGIVKSAGSNSILSEALCFLSLMSDHKLPLETIYRKLPLSFKTSLATMHRIVHHVKEGLVRRVGTALVMTPRDNLEMILVGDDVSTPRLELGKPFGATSLPMGYSKEGEGPNDSVLRILQREVFTKETVNKTFPKTVIPDELQPFMYIDIADVRVGVYHLDLPKDLSTKNSFSSYKLENFRFVSLDNLINPNGNKHSYRQGIREIAIGYYKYLNSEKAGIVMPAILRSYINSTFSEK